MKIPSIPNISGALNTVKSYITANSPVLLTGAAVAGVATTGVLAAKGGYKAANIVRDEEIRRIADECINEALSPDDFLSMIVSGEKKLTNEEKVKLTWLCYAAPAVTGVSTIASVVGAHAIHSKRNAGLAGLYAMTTAKLDDYQEKAEELLGTKKTQQFNNELAQGAVDRNGFENHEVIMTNVGSELCYDEWSGRWFMGSVSIIENAVNEINSLMNENGEADLNEFYDFLGLPPIPMGSTHGWSGDHLTAKFGAVTSPDGRPAISFWFHKNPQEGHDRRR